jgi:quaternary ammonium compound-resistance protein SugE
MPWLWLILAGLLEIVWAFALKQSQGFTRLGPSLLTGVALIASLSLLALAMKTLPLGTAYTVWTGIGALGAFAVGAVVFHEPLGLVRVAAALLIVAGVVMFKLSPQ